MLSPDRRPRAVPRARRKRSPRSRTRTSCASSTTARTRPARSWRSSGCRAGRSRIASADGPLPPRRTQRVAAGMAAGLAHLHARGLVHRDLKPANVLFDEEGRPKLGDFGLARSTAGAGTLTEAGTVLGTAAYISPEQAAGEPAEPASDVYSFGVILFRMLTGALPFTADNALALRQHAPARDAARGRDAAARRAAGARCADGGGPAEGSGRAAGRRSSTAGGARSGTHGGRGPRRHRGDADLAGPGTSRGPTQQRRTTAGRADRRCDRPPRGRGRSARLGRGAARQLGAARRSSSIAKHTHTAHAATTEATQAPRRADKE